MYRSISSKLKNWKEKVKRKPLILLGARQIGKTYSLKEFGKENFETTVYINFEREEAYKNIFDLDFNPKRILSELELKTKNKLDKDSTLLILDEIQECPRAINSLKYFSEEMPDLAIASAGSLLGVHLNEASFPVGKVEFLNMFPMSFFEFLKASNEELLNLLSTWNLGTKLSEFVHQEAWEYLKKYLVVGGLPESILTYKDNESSLQEAFNQVREVQENLIKSHLADISKHSGKEKSLHIQRIWENIPNQLARECDASAPKYIFKDVIPRLKGYQRMAGAIDWLDATGLLIKVPIVNRASIPLQAYSKDNFFKLFVYDVGILGALSKLDPSSIYAYDYGSYKGYFAENFFAQEYCTTLATRDDIYSWKEKQSEIEFLLQKKSSTKKAPEIIPIEIKSGFNTRARSIEIFDQKYNPPYKLIFSALNYEYIESRRLHRIPIYLAERAIYKAGSF